jgi:hypothetical protein
LKLPEVVNVILFQFGDVWTTDLDKLQDVDWSPILRDQILSKGGVKQTSTKKKKRKATTKATANKNETEGIETGATGATVNEREQTAREKETGQTTTVATATENETDQTTTVATATENEMEQTTTVATAMDKAKARLASAMRIARELSPSVAGLKQVPDSDDSEDSGGDSARGQGNPKTVGDDDDEQGQSDASEEEVRDLWEKFMESTSENLLKAISMGKGEVDERYLQYLDSMKNMGITTCLLADLQRKMALKNFTLEMGNDTDLNMIVKDLNKFVMQLKNGSKGKKGGKRVGLSTCVMEYGDPKDKSWMSAPRRLHTMLDAATDTMVDVLTKKKEGNVPRMADSVLSMEPVGQTGTLKKTRVEEPKTGILVVYDPLDIESEQEDDAVQLPVDSNTTPTKRKRTEEEASRMKVVASRWSPRLKKKKEDEKLKNNETNLPSDSENMV